MDGRRISARNSMAALVAAVLLHTSSLPGQQHACSFTHIDEKGFNWSWNLTALQDTRQDWSAMFAGRRVVLNVCRPPLTICRPAGQPPPRGTPTAISFYGPPPARTSKCGLEPCTQQCTQLGWGALGGARSHWSLIDAYTPSEGVRLTHTSLLMPDAAAAVAPQHTTSQPPPPACNSCCGVAVKNASSPGTPIPPSAPPARLPPAVADWPAAAHPPLDEYGEPRPSLLTVDLVCEPSAPSPGLPLEVISIAGEQPADTALRLRSPHACPVHAPPVVSAAACAAADAAAAEATTDAPSSSPSSTPAGVADPPPSAVESPLVDAEPAAIASGGRGVRGAGRERSGWQLVAALVCAIVLLGVFAVGFAPLSLRTALERRAQDAMHGAADPDEPAGWTAASAASLPAGPARCTFDHMEYRAI